MQPITPKPLSLTHLVQPPTHAAPDGTKPPLLLLLHGVGSNEHDLMGLAPYLDPRFLLVSARSRLTFGPGAYGWYPVQFTPQGAVADERELPASRDALVRFIEEVVPAYGADPARVFLAGFSQGAIMSLYVGLQRPDLVRGIAAMSGRVMPRTLAERAGDDALRGLPVFAAHGLHDPVLPITEGRRIRDELGRLPVALTYREYDMAHEISGPALADVTAFLAALLDGSPAEGPVE